MPLWRITVDVEPKTIEAVLVQAADAISGALTLKAFSGEQEMENRFGKAADAAYDQAVRSEKITMKMTGVRYLANVIQTMSLFLIGSFLVSSGRLSVGMFIAFVTMSNYITEAFPSPIT